MTWINEPKLVQIKCQAIHMRRCGNSAITQCIAGCRGARLVFGTGWRI